MNTSSGRRVAILFLGEMLLVPHLWPVVPALARIAPDCDIDLWVATGAHERLLTRWREAAGLDARRVRVRRAPLFQANAGLGAGDNPVLPPKLPLLALLAPFLLRTDAVLCAEQTSLWLPRSLGRLMPPFVKTSHGVGSLSARDDPRRRAARLLLVPSELERQTYLVRGFDPERVIATGYVKASFEGSAGLPDFPSKRPTVLYCPHWQEHRSSWWAWGGAVIDQLVAQDKWNVILAPHQRLVEKDEGVRAVLARAGRNPHVHVDCGSFAMVDGSYLAAADLYLGDTSSQLVEYLARPRPALFLNAHHIDWRARDDYGFWATGEVLSSPDRLLAAMDRALAGHDQYEEVQRAYAAAALGDTCGGAPERVAEALLGVMSK